MITEQSTSRYEVRPRSVIENSFSAAYESSTDAPVVYPPNLAITISSCISILLVSGMCVLTYFKLKAIWWLIIGIVVALFTVLVIYRHLKAKKKYDEANSRGSKRFDYKAEYVSLFPADLPDKMPATDLTREIAPMQNRQSRDVYNNAIRDLITTLNSVNNPNDLLCKNVNTYGSLLAQPRRRCYVRQEDGKFVVYDADFMNPKGELVIDSADVLSFGPASAYDAAKFSKGSKSGQDSWLIEIKTGDGDSDRLYLEAHAKDYEAMKKLFGARREKQ